MKRKVKKLKRSLFCDYRIYYYNSVYSIIEVFYDTKGKIISYSDIVIPTSTNQYGLKIMLSRMLNCTRKPVLTDEDLKHL